MTRLNNWSKTRPITKRFCRIQVSPQEIEEELMKLTGVQDVAVAGIPHESYGEVPMAFVVVRPGFVLTADEVGKARIRLSAVLFIHDCPCIQLAEQSMQR